MKLISCCNAPNTITFNRQHIYGDTLQETDFNNMSLKKHLIFFHEH